jgi:plasmid maintenance system antidote protein VapI
VTVERARLVKLALDAKWSVAEMATALQVTPRRVRQILAAIREVEADAYLADEWAA